MSASTAVTETSQALTVDAKPRPGDEICETVLPGTANLHSHAFQRGMAGLAEMRGPGEDNFWSWRTVMYRFALTMTPDDVEAVAAKLYCEMLEAGFTRVGEFHYLHHGPDGRPYANIGEMAERIAAASVETGIKLTLSAGILCPLHLWRRRADRGPAPFHLHAGRVCRTDAGEPRA